MRTKVLINYLLMVIALSSCTQENSHVEESPLEVKQLQWLYAADPINDAKAAITENDYSYMCVRGFTLFCPSSGDQLSNYYNVHVIEGTSDMTLNKEHHLLNKMAMEYAERYNDFLLKQNSNTNNKKGVEN